MRKALTLEEALSATRRALLLSDNPILQADALAPVLFTSNGQCLKTTVAEIRQPAAEIELDTAFYLGTLSQLGFGFYGRRREYRQIRDGLLQRNHRAVIIHGIGGIGKTSLISHVASRLRKRFNGVYAFDCSGGAIAPERIIFELHRYFEMQGVKVLERYIHQPLEPEVLANILAQLLCKWPMLLIFDNFETKLERDGDGFRIADDNLRAFITTLVKATVTGSRFLFTSRYLFDLDASRLGNIQSLPLADLSRPEATSMMLKLPKLATASHDEKRAAYEIFGGHPYALVLLNKYCEAQNLSRALENARSLHTKLREFLAIELIYGRLSERGRELINRTAAFRQPVAYEAAEWVMGEKVSYANEFLQNLDRDNLPEEWKSLDDAALIEMLNRFLPERRQGSNLDQPIRELIEWGLLTPVYQDNEPKLLSVHILVRDFCRDQQGVETWSARLRDSAAFYTNLTKLMPQESKSTAAVWSDMEAFELLMEAEDFDDAATLLAEAHPLLDRWGFGRHVESQYQRVLDKLDPRGEAVMRHNLGALMQARGNYDAALDHYQRSLKIAEDLGDVAGVASSLAQIGSLMAETGRYPDALTRLLHAITAFIELQSPDAQIAAGMLRDLRGKWGEREFDAAWQQATNMDLPDWLK